MAKTKLYLPLIVCNLLNALTINDWNGLPQEGITENTTGNFTYNKDNATDFILKKNILFNNQNATLSITNTITGDWANQTICGFVFCADTANNNGNNGKYTFNSGNMSFYIDSDGAQNLGAGYFHLPNGSELDINANLKVTASAKSDFRNGMFFLDSATLNITDANLFLDLSNNQSPLPYLFSTMGNSKVTINNGGNKASQSVILKGNLNIGGGSFELNLYNKNSYFIGSVSLSNNATFTLNLSDSSATFTTYSENGSSATITASSGSTLNATIIGNNTNLSLSSNSVWNMWGNMTNGSKSENNVIKDLSLSSGAKVNFMNIPNGSSRFGNNFTQKTLSGTNLSGSGIFAIYGDVATREIDTITFTEANGSHTFDILYNPNTFTQALAGSINTADRMVVATINSTNSTATFSALPTTMGLTSYHTTLTKQVNGANTEWLITNVTPDGESPLTKALTTALNTPYRLFEVSSQTLNLRLGDLRNYPKDFGLYFHSTIAQNNFKEDTNLTAGKDLFMSMVGGFDMNALYKGHDDFFGFGFEINLLDTTTEIFTSESQSYGGFLYYTSIWSNRFYYDIVLKYAYMPTDIDLGSLASSTSISSHLLTLSTEVGKKFAFNSNKSFFYIEPQAKLTSGFISSASLDAQDPHGTQIKGESDFQFPLLIRSSLYLGYEWNENFIGDLKLGAFIDYSLFNGTKTTLSDQWSKFEKNFDMDFDVGVSLISNIILKDYLRFYLQFDTSFMGSYTHDILFNAGIRWSFGDRYVPPPPPPKDPNRLKVRKLKYNTIRDIPTVRDNDRGNMKHYEGNRNNIIDSYPQPSSPQYSAPQGGGEESRNTNRFYPRDYYVPRTTSQPQESYRNNGVRDRGNVQPKSTPTAERYYKQDSYSPSTTITQEDRYNSRR